MKNIKVYINKFIALALTSTIVITTSGCSGKSNKISTLDKEKFTIENTQETTEVQTEVITETQRETQTEIQTEVQTETQTEAPTQNIPLEQPTTVSPLIPETNIESENEVIANNEEINLDTNNYKVIEESDV